MFRTRIRGAIALAAVAVLGLAACGDDDADSASPPTAGAPVTTAVSTESTATDAPAATAAEAEAPSTSAGAPMEVTVTTFFGGETTVPYDPETVVVLDFAALDTIDHLGLGNRVVGIPSGTAVPPYLSDYESSAENVGNVFEPDFETINALDPDLIVAGGRSQEVVPELQEIAPTVDMTYEWGSVPFLESLNMNTTALGQIFGVEEEAAAALAELDASAATVAENAADAGTGLVVMTGGGEVSAYGPDELGRFDMVYNVLGIQPATDQIAIDTHGDAISFEFLAETNPDMLIVLDRDAAIGEPGENAQAILDNDLVNGTNAVTNGKVLYVDTPKWYLSFGGLGSYQTMIEEVGSLVG